MDPRCPGCDAELGTRRHCLEWCARRPGQPRPPGAHTPGAGYPARAFALAGQPQLPRAPISRLETDASPVGRGVWVYGLDMILRNGRRVRLFKAVPSQELVKWLERAVGRVMRLGRG